MSRKTIIWLWLAAALLVAGIILGACVLSAGGWEQKEMETSTYEISEVFRHISVNTKTADVELALAEDGQCKVVCRDAEKLRHSVKVEGDTLTLQVNDTRKWYDYIGIHLQKPSVTIYLPAGEYGTLAIENNTGDVKIFPQGSFESIDVSSHTGSVDNAASAKKHIRLHTTTGHIYAHNLSAEKVEISATTGKISIWDAEVAGALVCEISTGMTVIKDTRCLNLTTTGDTGDLRMENVIATGKFSIERDTGDVQLTDCDAGEICIETDTGDVWGNLLSEKIFDAETDTGKVRVPDTTTGGTCKITTDTGDILITVP